VFCGCLVHFVSASTSWLQWDLVWNLSPLWQRAVTLLVIWLGAYVCLCDLVETCELLDWIADNGMDPEKLQIVLG
jgi:hypothetical protein